MEVALYEKRAQVESAGATISRFTTGVKGLDAGEKLARNMIIGGVGERFGDTAIHFSTDSFRPRISGG